MQVNTLIVFCSSFWHVVWFYQQCNFLHQFLVRWVGALYISTKNFSKLHLITLLLSVFSVQIINRKHVNSFRCVEEFFMMYSSGTSLAENFLCLLLYLLIPDILDYFFKLFLLLEGSSSLSVMLLIFSSMLFKKLKVFKDKTARIFPRSDRFANKKFFWSVSHHSSTPLIKTTYGINPVCLN